MSVLEDLQGLEARVVRRLQELRPLVDEYRELEAIAQRLGLNAEDSAPRASRSRQSRPRTRPATSSSGRRTRSAASSRRTNRASSRGPIAPAGQRQQEIVAMVKTKPGITVREIGTQLGVDPTSLYRIVRALEKDGTIQKQGPELKLAG
jgi:MarR family